MRWNSAGNFLDASLFHRAASSGIWRRSKPGWPLAAQPLSLALNLPMSGSGGRALSESRVGFKQQHRRRDKHWDAPRARDPGVDDVRPLLHHMAALNFVLRLVVDSA